MLSEHVDERRKPENLWGQQREKPLGRVDWHLLVPHHFGKITLDDWIVAEHGSLSQFLV